MAKAKTSKAKAAVDTRGKLSQFQRFEPRRMKRSIAKGAPYNPRIWDEHALRKFRAWMAHAGLLEPVVWNETTGNVVGGHTRLACLDALEGHDEYLLDFAVVKLTPKQEREANVVLNSPGMQGNWDLEALGAILADETVKVNPNVMGFDPLELQVMFTGTEYATMFSAEKASESTISDMAELEAMGAAGSAAKRLESGEVVQDPERHAAVKAERERMREKMATTVNDANSTDFMIHVVCGSAEERAALAPALGCPPDEIYVDGRQLATRLKVKLPKTERA